MFQINNVVLIIVFLSLDFFFKPLESIVIITIYFISRFIYQLRNKMGFHLDEFIEFIFLIIFYSIDLLPIDDSYRMVFILFAMFIFLDLSIKRDSIFLNLPVKLINDNLKHLMTYRLILLNYLVLLLMILSIIILLTFPKFLNIVVYTYAVVAIYLLIKKFNVLEKLVYRIFFTFDELIPIVHENDQLIFNCPRRIAHRYSFPHPTVHLLLVNGDKVLLQKRNKKRKINPNLWDSSVGGHVKSDQKIEEALVRETKEELGLNLKKFTFLCKYTLKESKNIEYVFLFKSVYNGDILIPDPNEIEIIEWWTVEEIEKADARLFTKHFLQEELKYLIN
jgi:isopentenyldiphosphate isomerase